MVIVGEGHDLPYNETEIVPEKKAIRNAVENSRPTDLGRWIPSTAR